MDKTEELLKALTEAHGAPGHENQVRTVMADHMPSYAELSTDKLGSLIATVPGKSSSPKVMVGAHMDEIGWIVREINKQGFIKVYPLGGWWGHVMLAHRVLVHGSRGPVLGVVGSIPPHMLDEDKRKKVIQPKDMYIDIGVTGNVDITKKYGIRVGDFVTPVSEFTVMSDPKLYMAKAFDNRMACALVCDVMNSIKPKTLPNTVIGVGSVQEEVGLRGATTAAYTTEPDVAIILDTGIAQDTPGTKSENGEKLGGGVMIDVFDAGMIPNNALLKLVLDTAEKNKVKYHFSSMERGATDAGRVHISRSGVPAISIGPPVRYIHSHNAIMSRADYNATLKLTLALLKRLDEKTVASFTAMTPKAATTGATKRRTTSRRGR
ncbi:MAG: M42 family metallopeptidase [Candidatus Zixiibacteriota bacterium]